MKPGGDLYRITNAGHDFLAHTRQSDAWEAIKAISGRLGGAGVGVMARVAEAYIIQKAVDLGFLPG